VSTRSSQQVPRIAGFLIAVFASSITANRARGHLLSRQRSRDLGAGNERNRERASPEVGAYCQSQSSRPSSANGLRARPSKPSLQASTRRPFQQPTAAPSGTPRPSELFLSG